MRKQLLNLKTIFIVCLLMSFWGGISAEDKTVVSTFTDENWSVGSGEQAWTKTGADTYGFESARGVQVTLKNIKSSGLTLTNTTIKNLGKIKSVSLNVSATIAGGSISSVKVGDESLLCNAKANYTITNTNNQTPEFTTTTPTSGDIVISFKSTATSKSLYVKSITVVYETDGETPTPTTNTLTITPQAGELKKATDVTLSASVEGAKIYYTTDGTEPTENSTPYTSAISVTKSGTTIKALAVADGVDNVTAEATYTIKPDQPVFSSESKTFNDPFNVTLTLPATTDNTSTIHYAIGATATAKSEVYSAPVTISADNEGDKVILHAVVVDEYGNVGAEKYCTYTKSTNCVFDFTANPNVWGITPLSKNDKTGDNVVAGKELEVNGVVMTATNGNSSGTCIYSSTSASITLRVYNGGSITFTAPTGYNISDITFLGSSLNKFTSSVKTYTAFSTSASWTGEASAVTFTASSTVQVKTATISLSKIATPDPTTGILTFKAVDSDGAYYATFSSSKDVVFANDVFVCALSVSNDRLSENELEADYYEVTDQTVGDNTGIIENGYYVPANTGVLVWSYNESATYYFPKTTQSVTISDNALKAAPAEGGVFTAEADYKYYKLAYNDYAAKTGLGFYWGAEDGGAFSVKAGTAYLAVPTATAGNAKSFLIDGTSTGINGVKAAESAKGEIYNLAGQRVSSMRQAGMYIVNGKKVIVRK